MATSRLIDVHDVAYVSPNNVDSQLLVAGDIAYRLSVAVDSAVIPQIFVDDGTTNVTVTLNGGAALTAGALATFTFLVPKKKSKATPTAPINFALRFSGNCQIQSLALDFVPGSVL